MFRTTLTLAVSLVAAALSLVPAAGAGSRPVPPVLTHGVVSGDVESRSALVWARASGPANVHVQYDTDPRFRTPVGTVGARSQPQHDFTVRIPLRRLRPDTRYWYRVWPAGAGGRSAAEVGTFRTWPESDDERPVSLVVGGDLGGQRYCRNVASGGYRIFEAMAALRPDVFVANGDMIYADGDCPADGPDGPGGWQNFPGDFRGVADPAVDWTDLAGMRDLYRRHWRYNRADPYLQRFLSATPVVAQWDDHEVINDFGARWSYWNVDTVGRPGFENLVRAGRDALFEWQPIARNDAEPGRIYRSFRLGRDAELFVLDARSYRDRNDAADGAGKHMLGPEQIDWLVEGIRRSDATWKLVASDVPLSIPTGSLRYGRDAWANLGAEPTGFEHELLRLLGRLDAVDARNLVFVTTDVHFAQNIRYDVDADADGDRLELHELVSGPLNAVRGQPRELDPAANPTSLYAEGGIFNFGHLRISRGADGVPRLSADVRDETGSPRPGSALVLEPQGSSSRP